MWTSRSDHPGRRRAAGVLLLACWLTACSQDEPPASPDANRTQPGPERGDRPTADRAGDDVAAIERALARRAGAVRRGDRRAFLAGVDDADPAFVAEQRAYLANLAQLPLGSFGYTLDESSLVEQGSGYWGTVEVTTELEDFDRRPWVSRDRYLMTRKGGRFVLTSVTDRQWESRNAVNHQPWDVGEITVRTGAGVLAVLDEESAASGEALVTDVEDALSAVAGTVPYPWERRVVVYALSDPAYLTGLEALPADDPLALDAVTVPVPAAPGSARISGTRVVLNPSMVATRGPGRNRLLRHELTHVALGIDAEGVPLWFDEGLAEYVSVQPMAPQDRAVAGAALAAAEAGLAELPDADAFVSEAEASYAVGWWACELIAERYGESTLWILLDELRRSDDPDQVLAEQLGIGEQELAREAGRLMLATYRPSSLTGRDGR